MGYFPVKYDSRVVIYERKMFIRLATEIVAFAMVHQYNTIHTIPMVPIWR